MKITIIAGTNRPGSYTLRVAQAIEQFYNKSSYCVKLLDLMLLPIEIFSPLAYEILPDEFTPWQDAVSKSDGIVIVTPEYNGSLPGILKQFHDLLEHPGSFYNKPVALIGVAAGSFGALRPLDQLSVILQYRNAHVYGKRMYISNCEDVIVRESEFTDPSYQKRFVELLTGFAEFVGVLSSLYPDKCSI
jgi:chromate reductase